MIFIVCFILFVNVLLFFLQSSLTLQLASGLVNLHVNEQELN
jgi:hypothetical protein